VSAAISTIVALLLVMNQLKPRFSLMESLTVQPTSEDPSPRVKPVPKIQHLFRHIYHASEDGTDENLLILLHGLGELTSSWLLL
jgi:hypothetical protein